MQAGQPRVRSKASLPNASRNPPRRLQKAPDAGSRSEAKRAEMTVAEIGYQILAGDKIYASGHVDPGRRYCPRDTLSLLPEGARTSPRIDTTDQDARIPSELLDSAVTLAELLTRSAAEMIAEHYYDVQAPECLRGGGVVRPGMVTAALRGGAGVCCRRGGRVGVLLAD